MAQHLANRAWPRLYDERQLRACSVPCAAVIYRDDAYVPARWSHQTAGLIPTMRVVGDPAHRHDGLDVDGTAVLDRLLELVSA